jgi:acetyl esterase
MTLDIPDRFKCLNKTILLKPNLTDSDNFLINAYPYFYEEATKKLEVEKESENDDATVDFSIASHQISRLAYEIASETFGGDELSVCSMDFVIPTIDENQKNVMIPVRFYKGHHEVDLNYFVLFIHGGGWCKGSLNTHDTLCRRLCRALSFPVIALDYRLAPQDPYPKAVEDAENVYRFLCDYKNLLGFNDKTQPIFIGDSGGGTIALTLILRSMKQTHLPQPAALGLFYPCLDLSIPELSSNPFNEGYLLTRDQVNQYVLDYIGDTDPTIPEISPLFMDDDQLSKLPYTVIANAECDLLTEQATVFMSRLKDKQGSQKIFKGVIHAFSQFCDLFTEAQESIDFVAQSIKTYLNEK